MVLEEVELPVGSLVIADLHIDVEVEGASAPFLRWLEEHAGVSRVLILGDLFEFWVGSAQADTPGGREVLAAMRRISAAGTAIHIVPGNRDFLLGSSFEHATGARVHHAGLVGCLGPEAQAGGRVLFLHGDELCTQDRNYQRLRRVVRGAPVRFLASHLPLALTRAVGRRLRRASRRAVSGKDPAAMAQQPAECHARAAEAGAGLLVCGHAHRFRDEDLGGLRWLVLDAFGGSRDTLEVLPGAEIALLGSGKRESGSES